MKPIEEKLGNLVSFTRGLTYSKNSEVEKEGVAVLRATNIDLLTSKLVLNEIKYIDSKINIKEEKFALPGDILICTASGSKSHLGKVALIEEEQGMVFGGFMAVLRCKSSCNPKFLHLILTSSRFKSYLNRISDGANINNLKFSQIENFKIFLPSIDEQQNIVEKLYAAFAEIDNLILSNSDQIKNAQLLNQLTLNSKIKDLPSSSYQKIGDVCSLVRGPFGGSLKKSIFVEKGFAIYEQAHPINNQCKIFRYFITKEKFAEMKRFEVKPKDILMSCSGVSLGRTTIIPANAPKGIINQALLKITPSNLILSEYLQIIMRSDFFQKLIWDVSGGAAQPNVPSIKILKNIAIPIPAIQEQEIFINWKKTLDELKLDSLYEKKQKLLIKLKEAILSNAMHF